MSRKTVREIKMLGLEKRRFPNKHYVYTLEVHWSTGATNKIYRRYSQFFEFQLALLQQFPVQGGKRNPEDRIIPFLPGKILFGRSHIRDVAEQRQGPISEYLVKLISLPHEVSESMTVTNFFEVTLVLTMRPTTHYSRCVILSILIGCPSTWDGVNVIGNFFKPEISRSCPQAKLCNSCNMCF